MSSSPERERNSKQTPKKRRQVKRPNHNELERKRRHAQKDRLLELRDVVPALKLEKPSTVLIMTRAKEYIEALSRRNEDLEREISCLKNSLSALPGAAAIIASHAQQHHHSRYFAGQLASPRIRENTPAGQQNAFTPPMMPDDQSMHEAYDFSRATNAAGSREVVPRCRVSGESYHTNTARVHANGMGMKFLMSSSPSPRRIKEEWVLNTQDAPHSPTWQYHTEAKPRHYQNPSPDSAQEHNRNPNNTHTDTPHGAPHDTDSQMSSRMLLSGDWQQPVTPAASMAPTNDTSEHFYHEAPSSRPGEPLPQTRHAPHHHVGVPPVGAPHPIVNEGKGVVQERNSGASHPVTYSLQHPEESHPPVVCRTCNHVYLNKGVMLDCDHCHNWYHQSCANLDGRAIPQKWICMECTSAGYS